MNLSFVSFYYFFQASFSKNIIRNLCVILTVSTLLSGNHVWYWILGDTKRQNNVHLTSITYTYTLNERWSNVFCQLGIYYHYFLLLQLLKESLSLCLKAYGEHHLLTTRILLNTGIMYEMHGDYQKAFQNFKDLKRVCLAVSKFGFFTRLPYYFE